LIYDPKFILAKRRSVFSAKQRPIAGGLCQILGFHLYKYVL
jgi:hypothetical protein